MSGLLRGFRLVHCPFPTRLLFILLLASAETGLAQRWRWSNPKPHGNNIVDMACRNGFVVQVAERGQIFTSLDSNNWQPVDSHTTADLQAVAFYGSRLIVTGEGGTVLYSDDGVNFGQTNLLTSDWLVALATSTNLVVAVGDTAAIYTSRDGASWKRQPAPPSVAGNWLRGAAWGAGTFVTVGEGGYIATSPNGTNWTHRTVSGVVIPFTNDLNRVVWLNTPNSPSNGFPSPAFMAVSDGGRAIVSTNNGVNWREITGLLTSNALYAVAGNDTNRVLAGDEELRLGKMGTNAVFWSRQTGSLPPAAPSWTYYSALWEADQTNGFYLLGGDAGMVVQGAANTNGVYNWSASDSPRDWLWQVTVAAGLYVAVGDNARILTSQDGIDWTPEVVPFTNSVSSSNTVFFAVAGTTNLLVAAGTKGSLALSPNIVYPVVTTNTDGSTLTNQVSSLGVVWYSMPAFTTNDLHGVGVFSNQFLVVGGNGSLFSSLDGTNWTSRSVPSSNYLSSVTTFSGGAVIVGNAATILTSSDGVAWQDHSLKATNWLYRVRCLQGTLFVMGENGILLTSTNGTAWTSVPTGTTAWLNDVQMVTNTCYIVGNQGTVLASTNFLTWTNVGTITEKSLYGAASQNGQLVIVGLQGSIIRAQLIPDLTPVSFLSFSRVGTINVALVAGQPDQRFTLDSSANLAQWATGPLLEFLYSSGTLVFIQDTGSNSPPSQFYRATLAP